MNSKKFKKLDKNGQLFTAGGLLAYDEEGLWLIGEKNHNGIIEWTDIGGKCEKEDVDIYDTISREVIEETFHSVDLNRNIVLCLKDYNTPTYVNNHLGKPVYISYIIHVDELSKYNIDFNVNLFNNNKDVILSQINVKACYKSCELKYIRFDELKNYKLKYRINNLLRNPFFNKVS
jgi:hypothetical protein